MNRGTLYIVATPIGNLKDISLRALDVLKMVDVIACEDTKHSIILLNEYGIKSKLISYHKFNEKSKLNSIKALLDDGENVALISDAGTPLISDPGFTLVESLQNEDYEVTTIPGACALVSALVLSGLDTSNFYFFGFLKGNKSKQIEDLSKIKDLSATLIFYISPHSFENDLSIIGSVLGKRRARLINEISKIYEKVIKFNLTENIDFAIKNRLKKYLNQDEYDWAYQFVKTIMEHKDYYKIIY